MLSAGPLEGRLCGDSEGTLSVLGGHQEADGQEGKQEGGSPGLQGPPTSRAWHPQGPRCLLFLDRAVW